MQCKHAVLLPYLGFEDSPSLPPVMRRVFLPLHTLQIGEAIVGLIVIDVMHNPPLWKNPFRTILPPLPVKVHCLTRMAKLEIAMSRRPLLISLVGREVRGESDTPNCFG